MPNLSKPRLFALTVGIDEYPADVKNLVGCVNDSLAIEEFLRTRFASYDPKILTLLDDNATYQAVINGFREFLQQAHSRDFVVIHFSCHGSRQKSAKEFRDFSPNGLDETLVLYDSRQPNGLDLADKELAVLLHEISHRGCKIILLMDVCHGGSITRGLFEQPAVRSLNRKSKASVRKTLEAVQTRSRRDFASYLNGYYEKQESNIAIPNANYLMLAACQDHQYAAEYKNPAEYDKPYGMFTWTLLDVLKSNQRPLSYADLFSRVKTRIRRYRPSQTPLMKVNGNFDAYRYFLSDEGSMPNPHFEMSYDYDNKEWELNKGRLDGLERGMSVRIYDKEASAAKGKGYIDTTKFERSIVKVEATLDRSANYIAKIIEPPNDAQAILLSGPDKHVSELQQYFEKRFAIHMHFTTNDVDSCNYEIQIRGYLYQLIDRRNGEIIGEVQRTEKGRDTIFNALFHVLRWERIAYLQNPDSAIDPRQIELRFVEHLPDGSRYHHESQVAELHYDEKLGKIPYSIEITNRSDQRMYAILLYLHEATYQIKAVSDIIDLIAADTANMVDNFIHMNTVQQHYQRDIDRFVVVITDDPKDLGAEMFQMGPVQKIFTIYRSNESTRASFLDEDEDPNYGNQSFWFTQTLEVHTVRQSGQLGNQDIEVANGGITIKAHPALSGHVALNSTAPKISTRSADSVLPLAIQNRRMKLMNLDPRNKSGQEVLVLSNLHGVNQVTASQPLEITLNHHLTENELLLLLTFDGDEVIPLGRVESTSDRQRIIIEEIPRGVQDEQISTCSVYGALKLFFFKVIRDETPDKLKWVRWLDNGKIEREHIELSQRIAAARRIYLVIHGIISDTENIASSLKQFIDPQMDLVLTYDYENLNEKIEDTANLLKIHLKNAGIHENGRKITIVAHSMGGLVSRWMIENLGGNSFVDCLIMAGTPNDGSKIGNAVAFQHYAIWGLSMTLKFYPESVPYFASTLAALQQSGQILQTLEQMKEGSQFLAELQASEDPGIPYVLFGGNVNELPEDALLWEKLLDKFPSASSGLLYGDVSNDIVVSDKSIMNISDSRNPAPQKHRHLSCNHLNYFDSKEVLTVLEGILTDPAK